jgi:hypothetical protein
MYKPTVQLCNTWSAAGPDKRNTYYVSWIICTIPMFWYTAQLDQFWSISCNILSSAGSVFAVGLYILSWPVRAISIVQMDQCLCALGIYSICYRPGIVCVIPIAHPGPVQYMDIEQYTPILYPEQYRHVQGLYYVHM